VLPSIKRLRLLQLLDRYCVLSLDEPQPSKQVQTPVAATQVPCPPQSPCSLQEYDPPREDGVTRSRIRAECLNILPISAYQPSEATLPSQVRVRLDPNGIFFSPRNPLYRDPPCSTCTPLPCSPPPGTTTGTPSAGTAWSVVRGPPLASPRPPPLPLPRWPST
jgi:hypothetical protein